MTPQEAREILSKINISVGMGESFNLSENQILEATSMAIEALEQQPCDTPRNNLAEWTPVSEGLPEDGQNVLINLSHYDIVVPGWYSNKKKMWFRLYQGRWAEVIDAECDVIAWQYFPEPYKEEGEDEE